MAGIGNWLLPLVLIGGGIWAYTSGTLCKMTNMPSLCPGAVSAQNISRRDNDILNQIGHDKAGHILGGTMTHGGGFIPDSAQNPAYGDDGYGDGGDYDYQANVAHISIA